MSVYEDIMTGLNEAVTLKQIQDLFRGIPLSRVHELATAEIEGRAVVLPVAVDGLAETTGGKAIVNCWDVVARVTFCEPRNNGKYWDDKYADFDIADITDARTADPSSWHETESESEIR